MDWFLYDNGLRHERVKWITWSLSDFLKYLCKGCPLGILILIWRAQSSFDEGSVKDSNKSFASFRLVSKFWKSRNSKYSKKQSCRFILENDYYNLRDKLKPISGQCSHFIPPKHQKTIGFLLILGSIKWDHCQKWVKKGSLHFTREFTFYKSYSLKAYSNIHCTKNEALHYGFLQ